MEKTAMQKVIDKINNVKPDEFCSIETIKRWCEEAKIEERQQIIDFANWLSDDDSPYAILYGKDPIRFATNDKDLTSEEVVSDYFTSRYGN